jgi:hypothetical protein
MSSLTPEMLRSVAQQVLSAPQPGAPMTGPAANTDQAPQPMVQPQQQEQAAPPSVGGMINQEYGAAQEDLGQAAKLNLNMQSNLQQQNNQLRKTDTEAAKAKIAVDTQKADELKNVYNWGLAEADKIDRQAQNIQTEAQKQLDAQSMKVSQAAEGVQNFQFQDYFADKGVFGKILGVVTAALSGAANSLAGQPGAPTVLDRIIQQDLDLQQKTIRRS